MDFADTRSARTEIEVSQDALTAMSAAAKAAHPREACGILFGTNNLITAFIEAANVHPAPQTHFEIDPQALINAHRAERGGGLQILGYFHSHPAGDAAPSVIDRERAAHDGKVWAICAGPRIALWRDAEAEFEALSYRISEA